VHLPQFARIAAAMSVLAHLSPRRDQDIQILQAASASTLSSCDMMHLAVAPHLFCCMTPCRFAAGLHRPLTCL
jgi:hypothetical protein